MRRKNSPILLFTRSKLQLWLQYPGFVICSLPIEFDVAGRIQWLRDSLDSLSPHYQPEGQHINIRALIGLYETGQKVDDTEEIWITNGQVVPKEEAFNATGWALVEVRSSNSL